MIWALLISAIIFMMMWVLRLYYIDICIIKSGSMAPGLLVGDIILVNKSPRHFDIGDLVVFSYQDRLLIKRISQLASEWMYVLGDHPDSKDSRVFGWISRSQIYGKPLLVLVSFDETKELRAGRVWKKLNDAIIF